ncbi:mRNA-binding protein PUF3 [Cucumispora dikerogammari]|nr:mRNA-binding protein PUF3 [Cucumispora dikerogammari]
MLDLNHTTESKDSIINLESKNTTKLNGPIDFPEPIISSQVKNDRNTNIGNNDVIVRNNNSENILSSNSNNITNNIVSESSNEMTDEELSRIYAYINENNSEGFYFRPPISSTANTNNYNVKNWNTRYPCVSSSFDLSTNTETMILYYKNKYFANVNSNQFGAVGEDPRHVGINMNFNTLSEYNKKVISPCINSNNIVSENHYRRHTTVYTNIGKNNKVYFNWFEFADNFLRINPIHSNINTFEKNKLSNLLAVIKDQEGSRHIQRKLDSFKPQSCFGTAAVTPSEEWNHLLLLVSEHLIELSCEPNSNYVIQKFIDDGELHADLVRLLFRNNVCVLSKEMYGCRVVQKGIEVMLHEFERENEAMYLFFEEIFDDKNALEALISDQNGNHVVQKMISVGSALHSRSLENTDDIHTLVSSSSDLKPLILKIISSITPYIITLSNKKIKCRVIQKLLETINTHIASPDSMHSLQLYLKSKLIQKKTLLTSTIINSIKELALHEFGNYVLQYIINEETEAVSKITSVMSQDILMYSTHKFASNVIEGLIIKGDNNSKDLILAAILTFIPTRSNNTTVHKYILYHLVKDKYGNYVVQQLYRHHPPSRGKITSILKTYSSELRNTIYSKYILYKLLRYNI